MNRAEMKKRALENLSGNWGIAIIAMVLMGLIVGGPSSIGTRFATSAPFIGSLLSLASIALLPISIGYNRIYMDLSNGDTPDVDRLFVGFKDGRWVNNVLTLFLMEIVMLISYFKLL